MKAFYQLNKETKERILRQVAAERGLPAFAVEKDWWVVQVLRVIETTSAAEALLFKGGTSLSKGWDLINRFSEDVDLAIDRSFLGIDEEPKSNKQLKKLRKKSRSFLSEPFIEELKRGFIDNGMDDVEILLIEAASSRTDPTQIEIKYPFVTEHSDYLPPRVLLEIGSRSMMEPSEKREISSLVFQDFPKQEFADKPIWVNTVRPERTFLEKVFLLHEEFQKPTDEIRVDRMSRHLYDIEKMMHAGIGKKAIEWQDLYHDIVNHRIQMTKMKDVNYNLHQPKTIDPIPPDDFFDAYRKDYTLMSEQMIYGDKLKWDELIERMKELKMEINSLDWQIEIDA